MGPIDLLVFQGTPFCNIDCKYCYLPNRSDKTRITLEVIEKTIDRILEESLLSERLTVLWHAGEPLVLPISFYEEAFHLIRKRIPSNVKVIQNIQTNLTLVNQEWCSFFTKYNVDLGISLDGPKFLHDQNRVQRNGRGTYDQVIQGIELLKKNNIPLRIICVISKNSAMFPEEIYDFFHSIGASWVGFNIDEIEADNKVSSYSDSDDCEEIMYNFYSTIFKRHKNEGKPFVIREIRDQYNRIKYAPISNEDAVGSHLLQPFAIVTVSSKGDFSTFCPEMLNTNESELYGSLVLGNVFNNSFSDVIKSEKFIKINNDIKAGVDLCKNTCEYFGASRGGAPGNKLGEKGSFAVSETMFCKYTRKMPIEIVLTDVLESIYTLQQSRI